MRLLLAASLALALTLPALAQDHEREKRWAAEVVPGLVVGDAVQLKLPGGREFLGIFTEPQARPVRAAVLLLHGLGVHPDYGVIGALRVSLADAGYATLSIQMPVLAADAPAAEYEKLFVPEALWRIRAGGRWLEGRGYLKSALLCHSMGCRMANAYYESTEDAPFAAWVVLGITSPFGRLGNVKVPVLDVFGEKDFPSVLRDDWRRRLALNAIPGSEQKVISGADHYYAGRERELAAVVRDFLARVP